jgi:hypothetical protein
MKKYCYRIDDDYYFTSETFRSRNKALKGAINELECNKDFGKHKIEIGLFIPFEEDFLGIAENVADFLCERTLDEYGEVAEGYMELSKKDLEDLEKVLTKTLKKFQKDKKIKKDFGKIEEIEIINFELKEE